MFGHNLVTLGAVNFAAPCYLGSFGGDMNDTIMVRTVGFELLVQLVPIGERLFFGAKVMIAPDLDPFAVEGVIELDPKWFDNRCCLVCHGTSPL